MPNLRKIRKKKNVNQKKAIDVLFTMTEAEWYKFFDKLALLINEYSQSAHSSDKNSRIIFFKFLKNAFSTDSLPNLNDTEKNILFLLATDELTQHSYVLTNIEDLKMLYDRFNVFLRVKQENEASRVLNLITLYADKIANANIELDKAIDQLDWHFTNLFWVLNVNFYNYIEKDISYLNFRKYFDSLQRMNNEIRRWDPVTIFSFRSVLGAYRIVRKNLENNSKIRKFLDHTTQIFTSKIIESTKNHCFSLTEDEIKECIFIEYVKNLDDVIEKSAFAHLSKEVVKQQVFPNKYHFKNDVFKVDVFYQQLTSNQKVIIDNAISKTKSRMEDLCKNLGVNFKQPINNQVFKLYIFKTKEEYIKYGPLWQINTAGGGYAHVRAPSENDRSMIGFRPLSKSEQWYETFIYQQKGDTRNGPHKEGGDFRNLGHETQHSLFYALLGQQGLHCLPSWMIEGAANALGNEPCFKEEADYIKRLQARLPSIVRITHMSYANGGDLYYFGSALFRFIFDRHSYLLKEIIQKAQNRESSDEINRCIKSELQAYEQEFEKWLNNTINVCSSKNSPSNRTKEIKATDVQTQYKKDLNINSQLKRFLKDKSAEFEFKDTVFKLEANQISRHHIDVVKTSQTITISDYHWFKSALEIYVLDNQLTHLNISQEKNEIIGGLVDAKGKELTARKILKILINGAEPPLESIKTLNTALTRFVLEKHFNWSKALKKSFDRQGETSNTALKNILTSQLNAESMCKRYIESQGLDPVEMLADAPHSKDLVNRVDVEIYNIYHESLNSNKKLMRFIKKSGSIKFTFSDTIFELFIDSIRRYDHQRNPQALTLADFKWFLSALEIYTIDNNLRKKGLVYNRNKLADILRVNVEYIYNREIKNIFPEEDDCFRSRIKKFILSLPALRSDVLTHRLSQLDSDPLYIQPANRSLYVNESSVLGTLAIFLTNSSMVLNTLLAKSRELTHVKDDPCDENNSHDNNVNWLLVGGGITAIIALIIAGSFFWNYTRKKVNDKHLRLALKKAPPSELEKLTSLKAKMDALEGAIQHKVSKDAYTILKEKFSSIKQNFEDLIAVHETDSNPNNIFYREVFVKLITSLTEIRKNLNELQLKSSTEGVDFIVAELRGIRPVPETVAAEQRHLLSTYQQQNPYSNFQMLTFKFNSSLDNENNGQETGRVIYDVPKVNSK